ncbi:hydrolase of the alpha/beta superfamily [Rhodobacter sp. AKP1]|nr:hydrolase of the alpha/beta superfamily [Rhodobacter sp. AKP1]
MAAEDGYPIRGGIWHAVTGPVVVLHAATAVQPRYDARFASWLSAQGGDGPDLRLGDRRVRSTPVQDLRAGWVDWGVLDAEAVLASAGRRWPDRFETNVCSDLDPGDLAARHGATRARLLAIGLTDDPFCTEAAAQRLLGYYSAADRTHLRIAPSDIAMPEIGHFAFFHARFEQTLWPLAAGRRLAALRSPAGGGAGADRLSGGLSAKIYSAGSP